MKDGMALCSPTLIIGQFAGRTGWDYKKGSVFIPLKKNGLPC